jgi:mono/diheme cytochrome c family protein
MPKEVCMKKVVGYFVLVFTLAISAAVYAQGGGMMGQGQTEQSPGTPADTAGAGIFRADCASCHPNGGNTIVPNLPLRGSRMLSSYDIFLDFIRHPRMPDGSQGSMPSFPPAKISNHQAKELYQYVTSAEGGMMGGYGMGPGMMWGYGLGPGMMRLGYYGQEKDCIKFLDETAGIRKEYYNKKFEYFEKLRNPETTMGSASKLRDELRELRDKINAKNTNACGW